MTWSTVPRLWTPLPSTHRFTTRFHHTLTYQFLTIDKLNNLRKRRPSMYVMVRDAVGGEDTIIAEHAIFIRRIGSI